MPSEPYLRGLVRDLAMRMIYLEHALSGAQRRGDVVAAQQFAFQRYRVQRYRSALQRQLWEQHRQEEQCDEALRTAGV